MKSLLLISTLSVLLSVCNSKTDSTATEDQEEIPVEAKVDILNEQEENAIISAKEPAIDQAVDEAESKPASTKPKYEGKMPDTTVKKIIEHGAPDKAYNDSVKAAKTKGKF
ncbi:MAG: hypothetical protein K9G41_04655 [Flavobacteriales bacterium]|nr:hypothetical protein [Flavobacteriales bacterium]